RLAAAAAAAVTLFALAGSLPADDAKDKSKKVGETPTELPRIPAPDPKACELPPGFAAHLVATGLTYPTSIEFDARGAMYVAEARRPPQQPDGGRPRREDLLRPGHGHQFRRRRDRQLPPGLATQAPDFPRRAGQGHHSRRRRAVRVARPHRALHQERPPQGED